MIFDVQKTVLLPKKIESFEVNNSDLDNKILIASQGTKFKNKLLDQLIGEIYKGDYYIKCIDTSKLNLEDSDRYDKILIITTCIGRNITNKEKRYINKNNTKIILFVTSGSDWKPSSLQVDTITSASRMEEINTKVAQIYDKLLEN